MSARQEDPPWWKIAIAVPAFLFIIFFITGPVVVFLAVLLQRFVLSLAPPWDPDRYWEGAKGYAAAGILDFFRNKEGSYQAQQSRRRFWLVLVADSHANPQVMQSHGDHGQGITHSGPRIAQNISDTAVSLEPSIAVFNADPS